MKTIFFSLVIMTSFFSLSASAGFEVASTESIVAMALNSTELKQEKESNQYLNSMPLSDISFTIEGSVTKVFLTYSDGDAPCTAVVEVETKDRTPRGAAGINITSEVLSAKSVCALNN